MLFILRAAAMQCKESFFRTAGTFTKRRCLNERLAPIQNMEELNMFDKLIESDTSSAQQTGRSKYFMASSVVVGILFLFAVVFSLYAANIDIGAYDLETARMLAPEIVDEPTKPEPEPKKQAAAPAQNEVKIAVRNTNMLNITETPKIPDGVSVVKNTSKERPTSGRWEIKNGPEIGGGSSIGRPDGRIGGNEGSIGGGSSSSLTEPIAKNETTTPPPVKTAPPVTQSLGVINGRAINLPVPVYPQPAKMVGASGDVQVQVTINEEGTVVSAKALSGHPLLRGEAQKAAWRATFTPTYLSNQKVKVTGVIVYKFKN